MRKESIEVIEERPLLVWIEVIHIKLSTRLVCDYAQIVLDAVLAG